jgi:hopanoid biosynthesis associated protein HpnK
MKRLIINGDDFGASHEANQGIVTAHVKGILMSASLMPGGCAAKEAVQIAKDHPDLGVGIHLTLVRDHCVLPPHRISGIVDAEGNFSYNPVITGFRYYMRKNLYPQLVGEMQAQIEQFLSSGLLPTHLDGHMNMHLHPAVIEQVLSLCSRYHIRCLRIPHENLKLHLQLDRKGLFRKVARWILFEIFRKVLEQRVRNHGLVTADQTFGLLQSGQLYERFVLSALEHLPPGITEMGFHPAVSSLTDGSERPYGEMDTLLSPKVARRILELQIDLCHYGHLVMSGGSSTNVPSVCTL